MTSPEWFRIIADNQVAQDILDLPENRKRLSIPSKIVQDNPLSFIVSIDSLQWDSAKCGKVLTFGRGTDNDVWLGDDRNYSTLHCSLYLNPTSRILLVRDHSLCGDTKLQRLGVDENKVKYQISSDPPRTRVIFEQGTTRLQILYATFLISFPAMQDTHTTQWWLCFSSIKIAFVMAHNTLRTSRQSSLPPGVMEEIRYGEDSNKVAWEVLEHIGSGGYGAVTRELDLATGHVVAVKTLGVATSGKAIIERELAVLRRLSGWKHVSQLYCPFAFLSPA